MPSRFVKQKLVENGWDAGKISVLPHFQNLPSQTAPDPLPDAPILYFGRLSPEKGLTDLLRAMQQLPAVRLQIAGEGPQRAELERLSKDLGLANVEFVGHVAGPRTQPADFVIALHRVAFPRLRNPGQDHPRILRLGARGRGLRSGFEKGIGA